MNHIRSIWLVGLALSVFAASTAWGQPDGSPHGLLTAEEANRLAEELDNGSPACCTCCCDSCGCYHGGDHDGHNDLKHGRVDEHAPAGLMGDHVHEQGEWMLEYKYARMAMDGNRAGTQRLSDMEALNFPVPGVGPNTFAATPTDMDMQMHMFHVMYGLTDNITLYVVPMLMDLSMDHLRRNPIAGDPDFTTSNRGIGDMPLGFLWRFWETESEDFILNFGMSVPLADIDNQTDAPSNGNLPPQDFPYPMRRGSGTFDFRPGVTYKNYKDWGAIGLQFQTDLPVGENDEGYRLGNQYWLNVWFTKTLDCEKRFALSYRIEHAWRENIHGFDPQLGANNTVISTARTDMRGGYWMNFGYGAMYQLPGGGRLNFEMTHPVAQDLDGVQLETDWSLFGSYSKAF